MIDDDFITNWTPVKPKPSEDKYQNILQKIQEQGGSINWTIFKEIYNWKASRSINYLNENIKEIYMSAINDILDLEDNEKINFFKKTPQRKKLSGILEPVASTVLHFLYRNKFPIIDIRTVTTLKDRGLLKKPKISYNDYRAEIYKIRDYCHGKFGLRKIDIALFSYSEEKGKLLKVLEGKKPLSSVGKNFKHPKERKKELITDLKKDFEIKLRKLDEYLLLESE